MSHPAHEAKVALRAQYLANPALAMVTDQASTRSINPSDPFHSLVIPKVGSETAIAVGVHSYVLAVGATALTLAVLVALGWLERRRGAAGDTPSSQS